MRKLITDIVETRPEFLVVGTARDGAEALQKIRSLRPDIVTLDIEMPGMDGLAALSRIMSEMPRPVVMLSAAGSDLDNSLTIRALELGAIDFVRKPSGPVSVDLVVVRAELLRALAAASSVRAHQPARVPPPALRELPVDRPEIPPGPAVSAVVIAASTGGPKALADVVSCIPDWLDAAILIVQHMPTDFLESLAKRLSQLGTLPVTVARDGEKIMSRHIYLAPGNLHMTVQGRAGNARIRTDAGPAICGVRPSADPLFISASRVFGGSLVGVVLTGMGRDGSDGLRTVREMGGGAIVQDRASSIIYGMPRSALATAGADRVVAPRLVGAAVADLLQTRQAVA